MQLAIEGDTLWIRMTPWQKLWALRGDVRVPLGGIESVFTGVPEGHWTDLRMPGTAVPFLLRAGSYLTQRGWEFWHVRGGHPLREERPYLTIQLKPGVKRYRRMVLTVTDNEEWAGRIRAAIGQRGAAGSS